MPSADLVPVAERALSRRSFGVGMLVLGMLAGCSRGAAVPDTPTQPPTATAVPPVVAPHLGGHRPLFGLNVPYADTVAIAKLSDQLHQGPSLVSRFVKLDSAFDVNDLEDLSDGGRRLVMVTLEPWSYVSRSGDTDQPDYSLASIVEGRHDDALRSIAVAFAAHDRPVLVRFAHEMNADWYPWAVAVNSNSEEAYVQAWRHVHDLVSGVAPKTLWAWAPVAAWWADQRPLHGMYPGDDYVDYVGVTGYARTSSADDTFARWLSQVRGFTDKHVVLAEIGAPEPFQSDWLSSLTRFLNGHDDVAGFVWFNTAPATTGATGDYRIDSTPDSLDNFRRMLLDTGSVHL